MNKKDIEELYYINREIEMWKERRKDVEELGVIASDGMPKTNTPGDSTGKKAIKATEISEKIYNLMYDLGARQAEACAFIASLEDSFIRQIIMYRCIEFKTWQEVANKIGGNNTADSCRKAYHRFFDKQK